MAFFLCLLCIAAVGQLVVEIIAWGCHRSVTLDAHSRLSMVKANSLTTMDRDTKILHIGNTMVTSRPYSDKSEWYTSSIGPRRHLDRARPAVAGTPAWQTDAIRSAH